MTIPSSLSAGTYYIWAIADVSSSANQSDESNDKAYTLFTVTSTTSYKSDLVIQNLSVSPTSGSAGSSATVSFTIYNQGPGTANESTTRIRINSSTSSVTTSDTLLASISTPSILSGSTSYVNQTVTIPSSLSAGTYYIWTIADVTSTANQSDESNDKAYTSFTVTSTTSYKSDLVIQNLSVSPSSGSAGSSATVSFTIYNQGNGTANSSTTNIRINSSSSNVYTSDTLLTSISTPSISSGGTSYVNQTVTIPSSLASGTYYIWVIADVYSAANQSNESNDKSYTNFNVTSTSTSQSERITNGSFSSGTSGWTLSSDFWAGTNLSNYRTSPGYAAGGVDSSGAKKNNAYGYMYQTVTIPSNATSATLSFWYNITSDETGYSQYDTLKASIQNSSGSDLATVANLSNTDKGSLGSYSQKSLDVTSYKGQTIRVYFLATTDSSNYTVFRIDDVSLMSDGN